MRELSILDKCATELAKAERIDQLTDLRSRAEAIRIWAKNANQSLEVQNRAAALRLTAERKAGKLLAQATLRGGDRKSNNHRDRLILKDLGISQNQSTRWQKQAAIPDEQFEKYLSGSTLVGKEITAAGLLRMANCVDREQKPKGRKKIPQATNKVKVTGLSSTGINYEAGDLREALNHVSTLRQVFSPFANDETETLSQIEKRAVLYYIGEVESLLKRMSGEWHDRR